MKDEKETCPCPAAAEAGYAGPPPTSTGLRQVLRCNRCFRPHISRTSYPTVFAEREGADPRYPHVPLDKLVKGRAYIVWARNFRFAVCTGDGEFTGIRSKYRDKFLDTEDHWNKGGTVKGEVELPSWDVPLEEMHGTPLFDFLLEVAEANVERFEIIEQTRLLQDNLHALWQKALAKEPG